MVGAAVAVEGAAVAGTGPVAGACGAGTVAVTAAGGTVAEAAAGGRVASGLCVLPAFLLVTPWIFPCQDKSIILLDFYFHAS